MLLFSKKLKKLSFGYKQTSLGLSYGKRIASHRGGGVKNLYRLIDLYKLVWNTKGYIIRHEYAKNTFVSLISYENGILSYQPTFIGSLIGSFVTTSERPFSLGFSGILLNFKYGHYVHFIELKPFSGASVCKAPGTSAKVVRHINSEVLVRLPSGVERWFNDQCIATLGVISFSLSTFNKYITAGYMRRLGWRPHVRGVAMNPVDHPHGGGEGKTSGGRVSVSRWGWLTKNQKTTRKFKKKQYGDRKSVV